jgi:5-guanidino-2-oxopentanoate decarboxylase
VGAGASLVAIAERLGAPVLASNAGKGILPDSHPLSLSCSVLQEASRQALADADVVLLVGSEVAAGDHFLARLEIAGDLIRIDIDPTELISMYAAAVPIQADARAAMRALSAALAERKVQGQRAEGELRVREIRERNAAQLTALEKLHARVWRLLRPVLPADTIVMGDATQIVYTGTFAMPMEQERCWYYSGNYCALGPALPMAIGARIGAPQRPVIAVAGDGGLMFTVNELATAAEERLALPVIVWNNDALQAIVEGMDERGIPRIGVEPRSPDFLKLAQSLGCHATRPAGTEPLAHAVREALHADCPTLIEIREDSPWLRS